MDPNCWKLINGIRQLRVSLQDEVLNALSKVVLELVGGLPIQLNGAHHWKLQYIALHYCTAHQLLRNNKLLDFRDSRIKF